MVRIQSTDAMRVACLLFSLRLPIRYSTHLGSSHPISTSNIAAAAAIGRGRSFRTVDEHTTITAPTLIIPGMDERHPTALAEDLARTLPQGRLAPVTLSAERRSAEDFAWAFAPTMRDFLAAVAH